jgi:transcription elongation factor Elf1
MGKHGKKGACAACGGKGSVQITLDNRKDWVTCGNCGGSGEA